MRDNDEHYVIMGSVNCVMLSKSRLWIRSLRTTTKNYIYVELKEHLKTRKSIIGLG